MRQRGREADVVRRDGGDRCHAKVSGIRSASARSRHSASGTGSGRGRRSRPPERVRARPARRTPRRDGAGHTRSLRPGSVTPCASQRSAMRFARSSSAGGCRLVVEHRVRGGARTAQQPRVVHRRGDDVDAALRRERQQVGERLVVQQRESSGAHHDVDVGAADEFGERSGVVHAGADRRHHPLLPQFDERADALGRGLLEVVVGVVQVEDVEPVQPGAPQRVLDRPQNAVAAEVPDATGIGRHLEALPIRLTGRLGARHQNSSDLGRDDVLVARALTQLFAHAPLGETDAVVRRRVEIADAGIPRAVDGLLRLLGRGDAIEVSQLGGSEAELSELEPAPHRASLHRDPFAVFAHPR